jgi:hypothetical protein
MVRLLKLGSTRIEYEIHIQWYEHSGVSILENLGYNTVGITQLCNT